MDRKSISDKCNFSPISIHCSVLVVIPLYSDRNNSLCSPSLHVRTYLSCEDPTRKRVTAQVSVVFTAVNGHHTNLKPTVRHLYKPPFGQCCLPALRTSLAARLAATHGHTSANHRCLLASDFTVCDLLQYERRVACVAGKKNTHISPYTGITLVL
jgi:hypothetical protein